MPVDPAKPVTLTLTAAAATRLAESMMTENDLPLAYHLLDAALHTYPDDVALLIDVGACLTALKRAPEASLCSSEPPSRRYRQRQPRSRMDRHDGP